MNRCPREGDGSSTEGHSEAAGQRMKRETFPVYLLQIWKSLMNVWSRFEKYLPTCSSHEARS